MKQVLQDIRGGETLLVDVPAPSVGPHEVLVETRRSIISPGTERMLVEFGRASLIDKARQQPEKVRQVLHKVKTDGLLATWEAVESRLQMPMVMGYSSAGVVLECGAQVPTLAIGDRVACNGPHAEVACVPHHLCAPIPHGVDDDTAAFTVLGSIALQGVRLAQPTLGEAFAVFGLGLVGLLTVQILKAHGCRVLAFDYLAERVALASTLGADRACNLHDTNDPVAEALVFSEQIGMDGVLLCASTQSDEPVHWGAQMARKRGRLVLVGTTGLHLQRSDFYDKELTFQVSCSYGPGRYDPNYENAGHDYPVGFVRWTEQRNFAAVLELLASGGLDVKPLITDRFKIEQAPDAYATLGKRPGLGLLIEYPPRDGKRADALVKPPRSVRPSSRSRRCPHRPKIAVVGTGAYAMRVLLPVLVRRNADVATVVSRGGVRAAVAGRLFGATIVSSDVDAAFADDIDAVIIATRHDSHAALVERALTNDKAVLVEKPLALTRAEMGRLNAAQAASPAPVMVGFNRRFSPHTRRMRELLAGLTAPKQIVITVNAGPLPQGHWLGDPEIGGGRIVGEACHFIDLARHLAGAAVASVQRTGMADDPRNDGSVALTFVDGSEAWIHYLTRGHKGFPKERIEVFCQGHVLQNDNFRILRAWGFKGVGRLRTVRQDKGNAQCVEAFLHCVKEGAASPMPWSELLEVTQATLDAVSPSDEHRAQTTV